ncbi:MAG: AAA family ATPase [Calditrichaeota bacterium]|nr:AAA family ATPase [Calditrichota bacterium]
MRVKAIQLSWFRGAADPIELHPDAKSIVVYGENGSGKSSFIDAMEYAINNGRISHLAHEYSGSRQEKAIPNTHKPTNQQSAIKITFQDDSELDIKIAEDGKHSRKGADSIAVDTWEYSRTILRQDEVANFIRSTKGDKYSALLPLLGLTQLEFAAENLRQLVKTVKQQSKLLESVALIKVLQAGRTITFGEDDDETIQKNISDLHDKYQSDIPKPEDVKTLCNQLKTTIESKVSGYTVEQKKYLALHTTAELDIKGFINEIRTISDDLERSVEPLVSERLGVLKSAKIYADKLKGEEEITCPACGQQISADSFQSHIESEQERLQGIITIYDKRKTAIGALCDCLTSLRSNLSKSEVKTWRDELIKDKYESHFTYLDELDIEDLRTSIDHPVITAIETNLIPIVEESGFSSRKAPTEVTQLSIDSKYVSTASDLFGAEETKKYISNISTLISYIESLENGIREEIKVRSQNVIDEISDDIERMWTILHPDEAIVDIHLYLPKDSDKAIDIGLKFYGKEQDSPRLTLSEGYRNSLGLCIYLAMAKRERKNDRPVFLDDVIVSLDRNHRGMIVELLENEFSDQQVLILTHDREWYTELRQQFDGKNWRFKALLPYDKPEIGMRWSDKTTTFDDARAQLAKRPDSAGNDARKIMDIELSLIAERLRIRLPYLRAHKNDRRQAHEFLERLIADGKKCFQKDGPKYIEYSEALDALAEVDKLLLTWGNRASHTFDVVRPEATKLIEKCETALGFFKCHNCSKYIWFADAERSEWFQCQCSKIRWRYGKI